MRTKFTLMCILACCVSFGLVAMPTKEETAWAEPVVLKLLESDQAALDAGKKTRGEVAAKAMQLADEADTEAAKLLLMKGAFVLYVRDGNVEKAVETMNALELAIADLPQEYVENMVELAHLGQSKKEDRVRLYKVLDAAKKGVANVAAPAKDRTTVQSIIDGMIKVPGRDYWLSETELTQGQWEAVMGYNLSSHKGANLPAENISRDDCDVFLEKLNQTREVCSSRFEFAIPTLLEWRYAAQAGGPEYDIWIKPGVVGDVLDMAWVSENSSNQTHAVATKAPNAFGFYDMLGNVWEWMYGEDPTIGCRHGFAFDDAAAECSVKRGWHKPRNLRFDHCGLRLVARVRSAGGNARESKAQAAKRPAVATESAKDHATCSDDEGCQNKSILDRLKRHGPK